MTSVATNSRGFRLTLPPCRLNYEPAFPREAVAFGRPISISPSSVGEVF
jgi:hypothetical protein